MDRNFLVTSKLNTLNLCQNGGCNQIFHKVSLIISAILIFLHCTESFKMSGDVREVFEALQAASISGNVSNEPGEVTAAGQCPVFPAPALEVGDC